MNVLAKMKQKVRSNIKNLSQKVPSAIASLGGHATEIRIKEKIDEIINFYYGDYLMEAYHKLLELGNIIHP